MRSWFIAILCFWAITIALQRISSQEPLLGDLLTQAWQSEMQNQIGKASSNYARAVNLQPENPLLRIKYAEMLILLDRPEEVARQLVQALELLSKDPKAPIDLKRFVCELLMGRLPAELMYRRERLGYEGWLFPAPFATLPAEIQKQVLQLVPKEWLFLTKASEAWFRLSIGEHEQGFKLLREAVMEGDVNAAIHALMSRFVVKERRTQIALSWLHDAEKVNNPFLWLASLHLLWRTQQMDAFKNSFSKALQAMKDRPDLLFELESLCEQMKWEEGRKQVVAMLPPSLKPAVNIANIRNDFHRALDEGDLTKVKALIRFLVDFPEQFRSVVLGAESIRKMLGHKWHDFVVDLIQLDLVPELPYDTKQVLLRDAAFNPTLFSHWMRLFMSKPLRTPHETAVNLLETTALNVNEPEPERAIWLLEQGLLICPDEPSLMKLLASAYERAGYHNRAIEMMKELVKRNAKAKVIDSHLLSQLWDIAFRNQQLPQLVEWLREQRKDFPLGYFVEVARLWMRHNKPQEASQWLDEAFEIAKERGWLKDAEIHALAYYLVRSPDPQDVEQAQNLRAEYSRTNLLFHPDTYELRLSCLVSLGKKDEARQVLEEATRLYPDYPFVKRVQGLAEIAITDWASELERVKGEWRKLGAPKYETLIRLAYATVKAGKAQEAKQIAEELMKVLPHWREGYLLAVNMFERRIDALLPFVRWVQSNIFKNEFGKWRWTVEPIGITIMNAGEPSLYGAFMIASVLLSETDSGEFNPDIQTLIQESTSKWWGLMNHEDREKLREILAKERLNQFALNLMHIQGYLANFPDREAFQAWLGQMQKSQTNSAQAIICQIQKGMPNITREQIRNWLKALEKANWGDANWCPLTFGAPVPLAKRMAQHGFQKEAVDLLKIAIKHAPEEHKANLMAQLTELTGKLPDQPKGEEAKDGKAWLLQAQTAWRANRLDDAKRAAQQALDLGLSFEDQIEALKIIAQVEPELALKQIEKRLSDFLVSQPNIDPPNHLLLLADVLYQIAEVRKDLAVKVLPLLERACNFSEGMKTNKFAELALVHFWVGKNLQGITVLFEQLDKGKPEWKLRKVFGAMVRSNVPEEARRQITKHLSDYLQKRKVSLSVIADELSNVWELNLLSSFDPQTRQLVVNVAPDSLIELAQILRRRLETAEGVVPRDFLERTLLQLKHFAVAIKPFSQERLLPDEVVEAWWNLFEAAFKKAAKTAGDEKSIKQWLRQFWIERPDTAFSKTVWFERLKKSAE
ncbi:MAG: hypothetical protein NZ805_09010 [Armatimonadetes bacterium]|nr:hypothetical protein [Armatimonadota bacterium]MDW8029049.1 hypothetical protein [Armatimonadota bacterium]